MGKPRLVFYGSSHAKRLFKASLSVQKIVRKYQLIDQSKSGSSPSNHYLPNLNLTEQDILIVATSGNSLFHKFTKMQIELNERKYYLTHFCPQDQSFIINEWTILKANLQENANCKIYLLSNILRHLKTSNTNFTFDKRILSFQIDQNIRYQRFFSNIENLTFIRHNRLLPYKTKKLKNQIFYSSLLVDNVHLRRVLYRSMINNLLSLQAKADC